MNAQAQREQSRNKIRVLSQTAMLAAVVLIMSFTPLGYIPMPGGLEMTLVMIPVVIGSIVVGPTCGAILGAVWGVTSYLQCFGIIRPSAFGAVLVGINPIFTLIMCVPTRVLAGWLSGLIFKALAGDRLNKVRLTIGSFVGSLSVAIINTVLFVGTLIVLFGETEFIGGMMAGQTMIAFLAGFIGLNGVIEAVVTCIAGGAVSTAVIHALKRRS